jgi:hypothetical protein
MKMISSSSQESNQTRPYLLLNLVVVLQAKAVDQACYSGGFKQLLSAESSCFGNLRLLYILLLLIYVFASRERMIL